MARRKQGRGWRAIAVALVFVAAAALGWWLVMPASRPAPVVGRSQGGEHLEPQEKRQLRDIIEERNAPPR